MKIRGKSLGILLFYYLGFSRIRNLVFRLKQKPVTRFVIFHDILPEEKVRFQSHLLFLKKCTNVVSLDDFFSGRLSTDKINVVITFDDGYKSWISIALPILKKLELPATFFVLSGFIGLTKEDEAEYLKSKMFLKLGPRKISGGLNFADVKRIFNEGFTIGGHTINHRILENITDCLQLRYEIEEDKTRLEEIIGQKIDYFAYPYGVCNNPKLNLSEVLKETGYKGAVTTSSGFNNKESETYLLNREITYASMPKRVFRARVFGNYDAVQFIKKRIRMIIKRP